MKFKIPQITLLNGFTVGKFVSFTHNGCQDAYLEFSEASRTPIGGAFCGQSWGPSVFYSETRSLEITVKLFKLLRDQSGYNFDFRIDYKFLSKEESVVRYGGIKSEIFYDNMTKYDNTHHTSQYDNKQSNKKSKLYHDNRQQQQQHQFNQGMNNNNNHHYHNTQNDDDDDEDHDDDDDDDHNDKSFMKSNWYDNQLNLTKTLQQQQQNLRRFRQQQRLKNSTMDVKYYLGDLIPGTYCSRIFSNCDKKLCRLQSPNFPGTYPRNLTCYYAVRQVSISLLHFPSSYFDILIFSLSAI
jgi:hypothetical protein